MVGHLSSRGLWRSGEPRRGLGRSGELQRGPGRSGELWTGLESSNLFFCIHDCFLGFAFMGEIFVVSGSAQGWLHMSNSRFYCPYGGGALVGRTRGGADFAIPSVQNSQTMVGRIRAD